MAVPVDKEAVSRLIAERHGGIDAFLVHWEDMIARRIQSRGRARDRATVYRWLSGGIPSRKDDVFAFAAALDVDPVGLMALTRELIEKRFPQERLSLQKRLIGDSPLKPFHALYFPGWKWPDPSLARGYFGRDWTIREHLYEPGEVKNIYAAFRMTATGEAALRLPRVYHFAYRRKNALDGLWRPYGAVVVKVGKAILVHENGDFQERPHAPDGFEIVAETFFGPSAVEFRVGCIHKFELAVEAPSSAIEPLRFVA